MPSIVTRPVITSRAKAIRLNWRRVVEGTEGCRQWKSAPMSIGGFSVDVEWRLWWPITLTLRQKPFQVRGFWRRYCFNDSISITHTKRLQTASCEESWQGCVSTAGAKP